MRHSSARCLLLTLLMLTGIDACAQIISEARYSEAVNRYGHFALGRPHEYARLSVTTRSGRHFELRLPDNEVFEDLAPRIVQLASAEAPALLTIISNRSSGARLALIRLIDGALAISAQSAAIGLPMRWLNPVGVADLDGDGRAEIAAVITPHIGGTLKIYRQHDNALLEVAALTGFSNHVYRSPELALSAPVRVSAHTHLLVPDATRRYLRLIAFSSDRLHEVGRCVLNEPISAALTVVSPGKVSVNGSFATQIITLSACMP